MYTGIKEVRKHNLQKFIDDFKRLRQCMIKSKYGDVYEVKKRDVWRNAKEGEILYEITDKIFVRTRNVMLIL